jgi:hypothetical protein
LTRFFIEKTRAQRVPAEKTSKDRPNVLMAKNEDEDPVILYLPY